MRVPDDYPERAAYVASGAVQVDGEPVAEGTMLVFKPGAPRFFAQSLKRG